MKLELEKKLPFVATPNVVRILDTVLLQRFQILLFVVTSEWTEKEIDASEPVIPGFHDTLICSYVIITIVLIFHTDTIP